jgi:predicted DNA-binding transcriptional regulator YafY
MSNEQRSAATTMEPLERLLNLVGLLLEARRPVTFDEIRETLEAYRGGNVDSAKRMFERDKDLLRAYGVPLRMEDLDAWGGEQGYVIHKEEYYLPEITFTPDEITALFVAARSTGDETEVEQGVRKLVYGADGGVLAGIGGGPLVTGSDARADVLVAAADAAQRHRRLRFGYRTAQGATGEREADVWGVVLRGGHWYLIGHDREREDVRAFRLSRVTSGPVDAGEGMEPPDGFRAVDHVRGGPWEPGEGGRAEVAFEPHAALLAADSMVDARQERTLGDGRVVLSIPFADEALLAPILLGFGADAEVLVPDTIRDEVVRRLRELADG